MNDATPDFAALGFAWDKEDARDLVLVFSVLGIIVAISCWSALTIGSRAFAELDAWWNANKGSYPGPAAYGYKAPERGIMWYLRPWRLLPWVFVAGWTIVFVLGAVRSSVPAKSKIVIEQDRELDGFKAEFK